MLFSGQDVEGLTQGSLVKKTTVAPSQLRLIFFVILADAETTNVRLDCVAGTTKETEIAGFQLWFRTPEIDVVLPFCLEIILFVLQN